LKPNGQFIGAVNKGATPNIRTVSSSKFDALKNNLLDGATASGSYAGGKGTWYDLPNGGRVGVRTSDNSGLTLDIDIPGYPQGFKVHQ
jgi:filamentous hemagglutinin